MNKELDSYFYLNKGVKLTTKTEESRETVDKKVMTTEEKIQDKQHRSKFLCTCFSFCNEIKDIWQI